MCDLAFAILPHNFFALLRHAFFELSVSLELVAKAAEQAAALPGNFSRVESEALLLGHFHRDRVELGEEAGAAELTTANPQATNQLRLIANTNLTHFYACVKEVSQVFDQLSKVDTTVSGKVEDDLRAVESVFCTDHLHLKLTGFDPLHAVSIGVFLSGSIGLCQCQIFFRGRSQNALETFWSFVVRNFTRRDNHDGHGSTTISLDDHLVTSFKLKALGVELILATSLLEFQWNDTCHGISIVSCYDLFSSNRLVFKPPASGATLPSPVDD